MSWKFFKEKVQENKENFSKGYYNCIPFPFERLSSKIPGIERGKNVIVTANSGVGKTKLAKFLYVFHPFLWCRNQNINLHVKYFALEETKNEFIASAVSFFLKYYYNIEVDSKEIFSIKNELSDYIYKKINELEPIIEEFLKVVDIQDDISHPTGILDYVRTYAKENGTIYTNRKEINGKTIDVFNKYEPYDDNEYVIVVTDHIGLLQEESKLTKHQTLSRFSADYGRQVITKKYNYVFVMVQQQSADSEKKEFNMKGELNYSKLKPTLSELADNKYTQRDAFLTIGLFDPWRFEIPNYRGYDMYQFLDNFRSIEILKNRDGPSGFEVPLYFNGSSNKFAELPPVTSTTIGTTPKDIWYSKFKKDKEFFLQKNLFNSNNYD